MGATTTNLAVPYPVSTDTPDVPRDVLALANRLDAIMSQSPKKATSTGWTASTSFSDITGATLSLPAGKWLITATGYFDFSTASTQTYFVQITDGVNAPFVSAKSGTLARLPYTVQLGATYAATTTVKVQAYTTAVDGSQGANAQIIAIPIFYAASW